MKNIKKVISIAFPHQEDFQGTVLAADIGGTHTRLALYAFTADQARPMQEHTYHSKEHNSFVEIVQHFHTNSGMADRICIGIAGPVQHGKVKATNLAWGVDSHAISQALKVPYVYLLNDLEANAYGLAALTQEDFLTLHTGDTTQAGNAAIIAPGTGLGEAGLFWDGKQLHPFPTEGGHADFAPRTELDIALFRYLQQQFGHVSWERVLSGPGIYNIYRFLRDIKKRPEPEWLTKQLSEGDPTPAISHAALQQDCPVCEETMDLFIRYLAAESANLVLKMKATGGLFLGGGIPPKILDLLKEEAFLTHFYESGRMRSLLEGVPVHVILNDKTALLGAAYYGAFGPVED